MCCLWIELELLTWKPLSYKTETLLRASFTLKSAKTVELKFDTLTDNFPSTIITTMACRHIISQQRDHHYIVNKYLITCTHDPIKLSPLHNHYITTHRSMDVGPCSLVHSPVSSLPNLLPYLNRLLGDEAGRVVFPHITVPPVGLLGGGLVKTIALARYIFLGGVREGKEGREGERERREGGKGGKGGKGEREGGRKGGGREGGREGGEEGGRERGRREGGKEGGREREGGRLHLF